MTRRAPAAPHRRPPSRATPAAASQRNHDALLAATRALLASGDLGQHNGLPASIIVTTTLQELEAGAGKASDRRRHPAADVRCDPAGRPRPPLPGDLRQRQSAGALSHQAPGLTGPTNCAVRQGSWLLVPRLHRARLPVRGPPLQPLRHQPRHRHQRPDFCLRPQPQTRRTRLDHPQKRHGQTEWIPPPHLDHGQPRTNTFHHPEKLLRDDEDEEDDEDP